MGGAIGKSGSAAVKGITSLGKVAHLRLCARADKRSIFTSFGLKILGQMFSNIIIFRIDIG